MKRICAWCKRELSPASGDEGQITHGICDSCSVEFLNEESASLQDYLNHFTFPVLLVDSFGEVIGANNVFETRTGRHIDPTNGGMLAGEAIGCTHSHAPGGCGKTIHCHSCAIRNTIKHTHATGERRYQMPAYKTIQDAGDDVPVRFLISSERVNDMVLLRIDDIQSM